MVLDAPRSLSHLVILRKWSRSQGEGLPTKDLCIPERSQDQHPHLNLVLRLRAGFEQIRPVRAARNAQVLHLLSSRFAGRKTAFRMTAFRWR